MVCSTQHTISPLPTAFNRTDKAAKTPASLTKDLSDLRLKHALLLEEHGVTKAALKHRETEYKALETHHAELEGTIESHEGDMRQLKELTTTLIEQRKFADKEISFLKEMVVRPKHIFRIHC